MFTQQLTTGEIITQRLIQGLMPDETTIEPEQVPEAQPKQQQLLDSKADITIYGGAAYSGKTRSILLDALKNSEHPGFGAIIFRRTSNRITNEGAMWDESQKIYPLKGGVPKQGLLDWRFPSGNRISFRHLEHEKDRFIYDGSQICGLYFDELTEYEPSQFWYLLSRNRSVCGIKPYCKATCNPDAQSWVKRLINWWIDQETGFPVEERSGKLRWFLRDGDELKWFDIKNSAIDYAETLNLFDPKNAPRSLTFIPAKMTDNPIGMKADPDYVAQLQAQPLVERERLLKGNWKIRPAAGIAFPRHAWKFVEAPPAELRLVRYWDKASTEGPDKGGGKPRTAGILLGQLGFGMQSRWYVCDGVAGRWGTDEREQTVLSTAEMDRSKYGNVAIWMEREGGHSGIDAAKASIARLAGFNARADWPTGKKHVRWQPFSAQAQAGNVFIVQADWDWEDYIEEMNELAGDETLDKRKRKDYADASAGAFKQLTGNRRGRTRMLFAEAFSEDPVEEDMNQIRDDGNSDADGDGNGEPYLTPAEQVLRRIMREDEEEAGLM